jgi:hypothetical protein
VAASVGEVRAVRLALVEDPVGDEDPDEDEGALDELDAEAGLVPPVGGAGVLQPASASAPSAPTPRRTRRGSGVWGDRGGPGIPA